MAKERISIKQEKPDRERFRFEFESNPVTRGLLVALLEEQNTRVFGAANILRILSIENSSSTAGVSERQLMNRINSFNNTVDGKRFGGRSNYVDFLKRDLTPEFLTRMKVLAQSHITLLNLSIATEVSNAHGPREAQTVPQNWTSNTVALAMASELLARNVSTERITDILSAEFERDYSISDIEMLFRKDGDKRVLYKGVTALINEQCDDTMLELIKVKVDKYAPQSEGDDVPQKG